MAACAGQGRKWITGTVNPICPVCHRGWRGLGLSSEPRPRVDVLPPHDNGHPTPEGEQQS